VEGHCNHGKGRIREEGGVAHSEEMRGGEISFIGRDFKANPKRRSQHKDAALTRNKTIGAVALRGTKGQSFREGEGERYL